MDNNVFPFPGDSNLHLHPSTSSSLPPAANSPEIASPGRRTPLSAVGLGGFYFPGASTSGGQGSTTFHHAHPGTSAHPYLLKDEFLRDENHQPSITPFHPNRNHSSSSSSSPANSPPPSLNMRQQRNASPDINQPPGKKNRQSKTVRLNINARERRRMHDLNDALDELRSVIPYAHSPSVRKLSKIATLLLAKNYILMQANALEELRRLIAYLQQGVAPNPATSCYELAAAAAAAAGFPTPDNPAGQSSSHSENTPNQENEQVPPPQQEQN